MESERELLEAIARCEGEPLTAAKIGKLANFYIVYDHLFGAKEPMAPARQDELEVSVGSHGGSELLSAVAGKPAKKAWQVVDEFFEAIKVLHPRMHEKALQRLSELH